MCTDAMAVNLKTIQEPIRKEMEKFEPKFRASMKSNVLLLDKIMNYIVKRKGKQMRPMFVFLSALLHGETNETTYRAAALIELLHTATLVHDDVVDDANMRRGFFSINALWKNKIAVLVGDYLLSKGLLLSIENEDFEVLKTVSRAVKDMSEGELLQIEKARNLDITEDVYFEIIRQKTAALLASCVAVGASSAGCNPEQVQNAWTLGEKIGMAFQIKDDLFDYGSSNIGKPVGIDIKEKKMTLPLIYALNHASKKEKRRIINIVKNQSDKNSKVQEVIQFVKESGGIEHTRDVMLKFKQEAMDILFKFDEGPGRNSLEQLINYTVERRK